MGMATIELLVAFAILLINLTGVILLVNQGQSVALDNETNTEALALAQGQIEKSQADAQFDFNLVNPSTSTEDIYTKNIEVGQVDLFTKKVTSVITWLVGGKNFTTTLTTLVTNPDAVDGGDTCSSVLAGDWTNPRKTEYEFGADILNDNSSGFPITSIQTFDHKMYVTVNNTHGNNPGTFFILNISDPSIEPSVITDFDNNPAVGEGLNSVAVDGSNYAYVANAHGSNFNTCPEGPSCAQLQVIDISNSANPVLVRNFKIPGVTGNAGQGIGTVVFYKNSIVYLGLANDSIGAEFYTIDVSNPALPIILDSYEIGNGVNDILVRNGYAYVASPNNLELQIFGVSDPTDITLVGNFDAPGGGGNNGNGKSLYAVGNKIYFGRTLLTGNEFYILDNTNPETSLPYMGFKNIQNSGSNTSVNGIIVRNNLTMLVTNKEFQILETSDPSNITQYTNPSTLPPGTGGGLQGTATDCEGNYIFIGSQSSNNKGYISVITGNE